MVEVKITGIDKASSYPMEGSGLSRVFLTLSSYPPDNDWIEIFNYLWKMEIYMLKRRAVVDGNYIYVECVPDEIEKCHLEHLKSVIEKTNKEYQALKAKEKVEKMTEADRFKERKKEIDDIPDNLDFS